MSLKAILIIAGFPLGQTVGKLQANKLFTSKFISCISNFLPDFIAKLFASTFAILSFVETFSFSLFEHVKLKLTLR